MDCFHNNGNKIEAARAFSVKLEPCSGIFGAYCVEQTEVHKNDLVKIITMRNLSLRLLPSKPLSMFATVLGNSMIINLINIKIARIAIDQLPAI